MTNALPTVSPGARQGAASPWITLILNRGESTYRSSKAVQTKGATSVEHLACFADFDSFVKGWVTPENIRSWVHFYPQHYFICDDLLHLKMDFVGRFENLERDFAHVQQQLGLMPKPLPRINPAVERESYIDHYSDESRSIVASVYANDIRLFSYDYSEDDK